MKSIDLRNVILQTDRLTLRAFLKDDLNDLHEFTSVAGLLEMAGKKHNDNMDDTLNMLESFIAKRNVFAVILKDMQKVIGFIGFYADTRIRDDNNYSHLSAVEIDYLVSREFWGQGIAPEAVKSVVSFCFNDLKLDAVIATHAIGNNQSKKVIEKSGFKYIKPSTFFSEATKCCYDGAMYMLFNEFAC